MTNNRISPLKEKKHHGTASFPCAFYQEFSAENDFLLKHHWHDELEILYFSKGNFHIEINTEPFDITSECFCFLNSGELHYATADPGFHESAIVFDPVILSFQSFDPVQNQFIQPLMNRQVALPRFLYPDHPCYLSVLHEYQGIVHAFVGNQPDLISAHQLVTDSAIAQMLIKACLLKILAYLSSSHLLTSITPEQDHKIEAIKKVLTYIRENYREKIYIRDLASLVNMNEQYFCRFFKKAIGRSPVTYINDFRIRQAVFLLENTNMQIMEICFECGFNNLSNFLREFQKATSTTPSKLRKNLSSSLNPPKGFS